MVPAQEERFPLRIPISLGGLSFFLEFVFIPPRVVLASNVI